MKNHLNAISLGFLFLLVYSCNSSDDGFEEEKIGMAYHLKVIEIDTTSIEISFNLGLTEGPLDVLGYVIKDINNQLIDSAVMFQNISSGNYQFKISDLPRGQNGFLTLYAMDDKMQMSFPDPIEIQTYSFYIDSVYHQNFDKTYSFLVFGNIYWNYAGVLPADEICFIGSYLDHIDMDQLEIRVPEVGKIPFSVHKNSKDTLIVSIDKEYNDICVMPSALMDIVVMQNDMVRFELLRDRNFELYSERPFLSEIRFENGDLYLNGSFGGYVDSWNTPDSVFIGGKRTSPNWRMSKNFVYYHNISRLRISESRLSDFEDGQLTATVYLNGYSAERTFELTR